MSGRRWHAWVALVLAWPQLGHAALPQAARDTWVEVTSRRFHLYTNAGESRGVSAARQLERLADVLDQTTNGLRTDPGRDVRVVLFRDFSTFKPFRPMGDDETGITAGFHTMSPDGHLIAYHVPDDGSATHFAAHEYLHAVLTRSIGELPLWLNEGLAEYYSTFESGARSAEIGRVVPEHLQWLRQKGMLPLRDLLDLDTRSPDYQGGEHRGTLYAQSWLLVHMLLLKDNGDPSRFTAMLAACRRGLPGRAALSEAYGPGALDSLAGPLRNYATNLTYPYMSWKFSNEFESVPVQSRVLSPTETLVLLGELAMRSNEKNAALAREHLESAWAADSTRALAAALLAELAERGADAGAAELWLRAVERTRTSEPRARGLAGVQLALRPFHTSWAPSWPARGADARALRARALLESALDANPSKLDWQIAYGLTFVDDSAGFSAGRSALYDAREAEPRRAEANGGLGLLEVRTGNRAGALALYRELPRRGKDEAWRHWVGELLARRQLDDAVRQFKAGHPEEAESTLARLERDVPEPGVPRNVESLRAWMRSARPGSSRPDIAEAPAANVRPESAGGAPRPGPPRAGPTRMGRALQAARSGDFATAEQLLEAERDESPASARAGIEGVLSEVRNQRRMNVAKGLAASGRALEACVLWRQVLEDHPKPDVRAFVDKQIARYCGGAPR